MNICSDKLDKQWFFISENISKFTELEGYDLAFELWLGIRIKIKLLQKLEKKDFNSNAKPNIQLWKGLFQKKLLCVSGFDFGLQWTQP